MTRHRQQGVPVGGQCEIHDRFDTFRRRVLCDREVCRRPSGRLHWVLRLASGGDGFIPVSVGCVPRGRASSGAASRAKAAPRPLCPPDVVDDGSEQPRYGEKDGNPAWR